MNGQSAECAKTEVPLDWSDPSGKKISYFVKRIPAKLQPARGQVWLLQGGPGAPGSTIEALGAPFQTAAPDLDVYVPDHRGAGFSEPLGCPNIDTLPLSSRPIDPAGVSALVTPCVDALTTKYGDGLKFFSSTDAARDVGELIEATKKSTDEVYVYGVSYGTRWGHRYLQQYPAQATGVILDSIVTEDADVFTADVDIDASAHQIFDACAADIYCSGKIGTDPWGFLQTLMGKLATGHCPTDQNLTKDDYRALLAWLLVGGFVDRSLMPAVAYRIDRCDPTDQTVIKNLVASGIASETLPYFSGALHFNVVTGEMARRPTPLASDIATAEAPLLVSSVELDGYRVAVDAWPAYAHDSYLGSYASTTTPLLLMGSPFDAQTPLNGATAFASHYSGAHQTFVVIDRGSHGLVNQSPTPTGNCGMDIIGQFINDPTATIDQSCNADVLPFDFHQVGSTFGPGTLDLWENGMMLVLGYKPQNDRLLALRAQATQKTRGAR